MKHRNVMLAEQIELVQMENEILKEEVRTLKKSGMAHVLKVEQQQKKKDAYVEEQELMQEEHMNDVEKMLVNSEEMNVEFKRILEETDNKVE